MEENIFDKLEDYLSTLSDNFSNLPNCLEKIMIISKINELVFWIQMYQDKEKQAN